MPDPLADLLRSEATLVMAVVNRTRDSFHDRGATFTQAAAVAAGLAAARAGAHLVDVGGMAFGADAEVVAEAEEIDRVVPVVAELCRRSEVVVSVDTFRAAVAREALAAGACVINDTSGLADPGLATVAAEAGAHLVLTHSLAPPGQRLGAPPRYHDVVAEVLERLAGLVARARTAGVAEDRLLLDPGPDLHKNTRHTLALLAGLDRVVALGHPTLLAVSNKDFVGEVLDRPAAERLPGTLAATVAGVLAGARIVRAHDVVATLDAVRMVDALRGRRQPVHARHNC